MKKSIYISDYGEDLSDNTKRFLLVEWEGAAVVKAESCSTVWDIHKAIDDILRAKE